MRIGTVGLAALVLLTVAGCAKRELILPGERFDVRDPLAASLPEGVEIGAATPLGSGASLGVPENQSLPISLPAQTNLSSWPQRAGNATHTIPHLALGTSLTRLWSGSVGKGNDRKHRITADPVVDQGRVFTLDSRARVTAFSTAGAVLWTRDLTPSSDKPDDASGGGLAVSGGKLFVTSGFGMVAALDAATGNEIWNQRLDAVVTASPTVSGDLLYVVSRDNRAYAIRTDNGRVSWEISGTPSPSGYTGGAGAAVDGRVAIFPFDSGELVSVLKQSGVRTWGTNISGQRRGRVYAGVSDIASDPLLAGTTLYAANASGRLVAANAGSGERLWTANEGAFSPVIVVGGSVFMVTDAAEVVRLDAATGERIWGTPLPNFVKEKNKKRKAVFAHFGPVLAGGRLVVASDDDMIRFFDPVSGALTGTTELPGGAATNPVVVDRVLYVVSGNGQLHAFR